MKKLLFIFQILTVVFLLFFLFPLNSLAKTDLSLTATDITFSKMEPLEGDKVQIFARVFNIGNVDVYGFVIFLNNGEEISDPQPISVKVNTYDDVFIDWTVKVGIYNIQAEIIATNPQDDNLTNDIAVHENYIVDLDTDGDGIGNIKDTDDDGDSLSDEKEIILGTDPLNPDSDWDRIRDNIDPFSLDSTEWQDSDKDGIGDNTDTDTDDDNDGLTDEEELFIFGTNSLNPDSDNDGLSDKEEIDLGTDALQMDSDRDGVIDSKDAFPLNPDKTQASIIEAVKTLVKNNEFSKTQILTGTSLILVVLIFFFFRRRKR